MEIETSQKREKAWGGREVADDGATGRSVKTLQLHNVGSAEKRKLAG